MRFARALSGLVFVLVLSLASCEKKQAELDVDIPTSATATPQYFHGNCFAGWSMAVELRVRETRGVEVVLDELSYRVFDTAVMEEHGAEVLDRTSLESRYGSTASVLAGGSTRSFPLGFPTHTRPVGPLTVSVALSGRDENGRAVSSSFALTTTVTVVGDDAPPQGGACQPP